MESIILNTINYLLSSMLYEQDNPVEICEVFDYKRSSLQDWVKLYNEIGSTFRYTSSS